MTRTPRHINIPPRYHPNFSTRPSPKGMSPAMMKKLARDNTYQPDLFTWDGLLIGLERTLHQLPLPSLPYRH
jgi:hypothetical protein